MPLRIDRLVAVLAVATLFLPAFRLRSGPVDLYLSYALLPIVLALSVAAGSNLVSRGLALFLAGLTAHSIATVALFGGSPESAAQQLVGIAVVSVVLYNAVQVNRFDPLRLFSIYMSFAKLCALVAVVQFACYLAGIRQGYDLSWAGLDVYQSYTISGLPRIQSIFGEPSHFALAMSPAIFVSLLALLGVSSVFASRVWSSLILATTALSFSTMAFVTMVFALCLVGLRSGFLRATVLASTAGLLAIAAYGFVPEVRMRVDDTVLVFLQGDALQKNISTLTLYNNWQVALGNLADSYMLGGGLGSHSVAFDRHSTLQSVESVPYWLASLNAQDANSLFIRITSELGLPGLIALCGFLIRYRVPPTRRGSELLRSSGGDEDAAWIVSNAALTFITMALVRHGHYFATGTPFFLLLYCYAWRCYRSMHSVGYASAEQPEPTVPARAI